MKTDFNQIWSETRQRVWQQAAAKPLTDQIWPIVWAQVWGQVWSNVARELDVKQ